MSRPLTKAQKERARAKEIEEQTRLRELRLNARHHALTDDTKCGLKPDEIDKKDYIEWLGLYEIEWSHRMIAKSEAMAKRGAA